jgi:hypothetical protein
MHPGAEADETQLPDLALYERLISDGMPPPTPGAAP